MVAKINGGVKMAGIIDGKGQQWEKCNYCGTFVRFPENLGFEPETKEHPYGMMICLKCTNNHPNIESIRPAPEWVRQYE